MSQKIEIEDGTEVEMFTAEEVTAKATEAAEAARAEGKTALEAKEAELTEARRLNAERGENFTRYSKMSEEEKKAYDANTTALLKREEALVTELEGLKTTLTEKETRERNTSKDSAMKSIHADNAEVKTKLETSYAALAGMPESTQEEINARVAAAARVAGIQVDQRNPLYAAFSGEAPGVRDTKKEYTDTPEGSQAADMVRGAMGIPNPNKK